MLFVPCLPRSLLNTCGSCAPPIKQRKLRRLTQGNVRSAENAGGAVAASATGSGDGTSTDGVSSTSEWQQVEELESTRREVAARHRELQRHVERQDYAAAAKERDALRLPELRQRQLELAVATCAKAGAGVRYALGAVIQHARYSYRGVIVGYDPVCMAPEEWIKVMHVDSLASGRSQPFYHVLVDERDRAGSQTTYVAQENIVPMRAPREVRHALLPRFFSAFSPEEGGYRPSPLLCEAYPQDF